MDLSSMSDADLMSAIKALPQPGAQPAPDQPPNTVQPYLGSPPPGSEVAPSASKSPADMSDAELMAAIGKAAPSGGIARNAGAGADEALYNTLGAPVDAMTWAMNKGVQGVNAAAGTHIPQIQHPFGGSQSMADAFGAIGTPDPSTITATTPAEQIARGVGSGIGYAVAPEAAAAGLMRAGAIAPRFAEAVGNAVGRADTLGSVAGNAVAGGTAGGGATVAEQAVPDAYKPIAGLAGGLAGGLVGAGALAVPRALGQAGGLVRDYAAPLSAGGRARIAGQTLQDAATNPAAVRETLDNLPAPLVAGSNPTTFQVTGDMGLGGLERSAAAKAPDVFNQVRADQNSARLSALSNIQADGHPEAVASTLRARLGDIDTQTDAAVQNAYGAATQRANALGGTGVPEDYGATLRDAVQRSEQSARQNERGLWQAVDPTGTLTLPSANVTSRARSIASNMPATAAPIAGEEAGIFNVASSLPPVVPFVDASALRSRISQAMRQEMMTAGQSPSYGRLSQLRSAVQDDIDGVVAQRAKQDAQAVASGQMAPGDAIGAQLVSEVRSARDRWLAEQSNSAQSRAADGSGTGAAYPAGPSGFSSAFGTESQSGRRFSQASGNSGVPGAASFDDAARERLTAAADATRDRAQTFGAAPNAAILRRSGYGGPYNLPAAAVPSQIFYPGPKSAAAIGSFRQAVGDGPALATLQDYAASQLRRAATTADGTLNPNTVANWRRAHADALRSFPDLDASFADAASASNALAATATARREALDTYQQGVVGQLVGATNPTDVTRTIGSIFGRKDSVLQMQRLASEAGQTQDGAQGLRKAVADYMLNRLVSNTEAATSGRGTLKSDQFQSFVRDNTPALRAVFSGDEVKLMGAVADDLQRANRSIAAVKLPGGSNTAQDTFAVNKGDTAGSALTKIIFATGSAGAIGHVLGGPLTGAAATIGAGTVMALRQAGLHKVDDLVREALIDPATARALLAKAPEKPDSGPYIALAQRVRRSAAAGAATTEETPAPVRPAMPPPAANRGILHQMLGAYR